MKTIVMGNLKGGVGKTTAAVNLACVFSAKRGQKVLLADLDPQCNLTSVYAKVSNIGRNVGHVLTDPAAVKKSILKTNCKNISIIRGSSRLSEGMCLRPDALKAALWTVEGDYDLCIIDTRPVFENLTKVALTCADLLLVPITLDKFCRDNLALVDEFLQYNADTLRWKAFANKVDCRRKAQKLVYRDLIGCQDYPILNSCVRMSADIDNALALSKPVLKHRSKSAGEKDYEDLTDEVSALLAIKGGNEYVAA